MVLSYPRLFISCPLGCYLSSDYSTITQETTILVSHVTPTGSVTQEGEGMAEVPPLERKPTYFLAALALALVA